jgi:hypothetical protein
MKSFAKFLLLFAFLIAPVFSQADYISVRPGLSKPSLTSFTPALSVNTNCTRTGRYYKNADGQMVINYRLLWTGASGGAGAAMTLALPSGYTFDQSRYLGTFDGVESTATKLPLEGYFFNHGSNVEGYGLYANNTNTMRMHRFYNGVIGDDGFDDQDNIDVWVKVWVVGPGY